MRYDHLPLKTKDGRTAQVEFVSNAYSVDGTRVIQCNIRDISERVRLERHVAAQAEDLADLHRRKDEFLAMLAHELRNPLSPIVNSVALLRAQGSETSVQRHAREVIERQVGQLTRLVDDLVEVSRVTLWTHPARQGARGSPKRPLVGRLLRAARHRAAKARAFRLAARRPALGARGREPHGAGRGEPPEQRGQGRGRAYLAERHARGRGGRPQGAEDGQRHRERRPSSRLRAVHAGAPHARQIAGWPRDSG